MHRIMRLGGALVIVIKPIGIHTPCSGNQLAPQLSKITFLYEKTSYFRSRIVETEKRFTEFASQERVKRT